MSLLSSRVFRRWVRACLALCLLVVVVLFGVQIVATSAGPAASIPDWLFLAGYSIAPLLTLLFIFVLAPVTIAILIFALGTGERLRRGMIEVGSVCASAVILLATGRVADELRMQRLEATTRRLTPAARAYLADPQHRPIPELGVRGCTELTAVEIDGITELWSECSRGIGRWDRLYFRADGSYPKLESVQLLGAWAYHWD